MIITIANKAAEPRKGLMTSADDHVLLDPALCDASRKETVNPSIMSVDGTMGCKSFWLHIADHTSGFEVWTKQRIMNAERPPRGALTRIVRVLVREST